MSVPPQTLEAAKLWEMSDRALGSPEDAGMENLGKYQALLVSGARRLSGWRRREFIA
jgi:hypothetical protein